MELLLWEGCASYPEARELLRKVLAEHGIEEPIVMREVVSQEDAVELVFPGSPTIGIDGRDVDPEGATSPPALSCGMYRADGWVSGLPSREQLAKALS